MPRTKRDRADPTGPVPGSQHDTESRAISAHSIRPFDGHAGGLAPYVPTGGTVRVPDHLALRPPETGSRIQDQWSRLITPLRAPALAWLWLTAYWWRPAILTGLVVALVTLWRYGS